MVLDCSAQVSDWIRVDEESERYLSAKGPGSLKIIEPSLERIPVWQNDFNSYYLHEAFDSSQPFPMNCIHNAQSMLEAEPPNREHIAKADLPQKTPLSHSSTASVCFKRNPRSTQCQPRPLPPDR